MMRQFLLATTAFVALCGSQPAFANGVGSIAFSPVSAPVTDKEKREVRASSEVTVDGKTSTIGFTPLVRSGDKIGDNTFGLVLDETGKPIVGADGAPMVSNDIDFSSLLQQNGKIYVVSHFETRPAMVYVTELAKDGETGELKAISTSPVDFADFGGLWVPCAGSLTPWGTHLGSEEYEPDANAVETATELSQLDDYMKPMALYFGYDAMAAGATIDGFRKVFNPYRYGYITEISVDDAGKGTGVKHYAMGRFSHELGYVLPDEKTVYMSDDGSNVGLYRFVADVAGKLDSGRLYAAKWEQTSAENGGEANISWIDLGAGSSDDVKALIDKGTKFSDIFDSAKMDDKGQCPEGFTASAANDVKECLKVKDGMDFAASRLETRRYAAVKGATTEIRKEEGITYDGDHNRLYVAISEISNGMDDMAKDGKYDIPSANHIKVAENKCGGVYALDLDENFAATNMKAIVTGKPHKYEDGPFAGNTCDIDGLANPDNISYVPARNTLIIGEDTGSGHQNDAVWSMDLATKELTRIETTPYGSETTSVYVYPNVGGHAYIMSVVQHPYGESDEDKLRSPADAKAYMGYIGPMPALMN
ncbi:alkaline phosphatase [Hartmannibacter diazotrophicus]|uniref:Alkaline phosphatase n=1 Tax=Hartmannibacter diazotrophicus TaxID=1482074 RepID=A0A2C9D9V1_9HYPH|nr:alkaline phosphatase PhoX [Hartmannibacter diazotrophicus]SON56365.1 alkaline phosphatase [Hartmannibacter diazotrophicus]